MKPFLLSSVTIFYYKKGGRGEQYIFFLMLSPSLVTPALKKVLVLLSALVERFGVSRMRIFLMLDKMVKLFGGGCVINRADPFSLP